MSPSPRYLVLGSGGREHALVYHLKKMGLEVFAAPGSAAIAKLAECFSFQNSQDLLNQIQKFKIQEVIVGPEKYLADGTSDFLIQNKIPCFGPSQKAAQLETDKAWSKSFMERNQIPTARSVTTKSASEISSALSQFQAPYVLKASGLAAGKGVLVTEDKQAAESFGRECLKEHPAVVVEEFISGEEVSVFYLIDGESYLFFGEAQDHKRLLENNRGPNTGGMGTISPSGLADAALLKKIEDKILLKTLSGLKKENLNYRGFIFLGLMISKSEPYLLEYNCRMGDPETQSLMMRLETPLSDLIESLKSKTPMTAKWNSQQAVSVVVAGKNYPESSLNDAALPGLEETPVGLQIFHSGTALVNSEWQARGGRLFCASVIGSSISDCHKKIYPWLDSLKFLDKVRYRKDIGLHRG